MDPRLWQQQQELQRQQQQQQELQRQQQQQHQQHQQPQQQQQQQQQLQQQQQQLQQQLQQQQLQQQQLQQQHPQYESHQRPPPGIAASGGRLIPSQEFPPRNPQSLQQTAPQWEMHQQRQQLQQQQLQQQQLHQQQLHQQQLHQQQQRLIDVRARPPPHSMPGASQNSVAHQGGVQQQQLHQQQLHQQQLHQQQLHQQQLHQQQLHQQQLHHQQQQHQMHQQHPLHPSGGGVAPDGTPVASPAAAPSESQLPRPSNMSWAEQAGIEDVLGRLAVFASSPGEGGVVMDAVTAHVAKMVALQKFLFGRIAKVHQGEEAAVVGAVTEFVRTVNSTCNILHAAIDASPEPIGMEDCRMLGAQRMLVETLEQRAEDLRNEKEEAAETAGGLRDDAAD